MYRFLLRACFLGAVLFMSFADVKGQSYTTKTEKIKLEKDTVWIINSAYNLYKQELRLTLDFSEQTPKPTRVQWEANSASQPVSGSSMTYFYPAGLHELKLTAADGHIYHYMVFNDMLKANFEVKPDPFRYCIEKGGDSLLIIKKDFEDNPPGTVYDIVVEGPDPIFDTIPVLSSYAEWFGPKQDSAWVVFYQPTGVKPCNVYLSLKYTDTEKGIALEEQTNVQRISVYGAPNVKKIFGFYPEDHFEEGSNMTYMEVCNEANQTYLNLDESLLQYFQVKLRTPQAVPYYSSHEQNQDLEIHYYYSDTIYDGMPEDNWEEVTGLGHMVSVEQSIAFKTAGYYKMMITAENLCNDVGEVKKDTLWTDFVEGSPDKHRYFKVFSYDSAKLVCKTERLCLNESKRIKIVDYNSRRGYEEPPEYNFHLNFQKPSPYVDYTFDGNALTTEIQIWRGGNIVKPEAAKDCGCDSTVIYLTLTSGSLYGKLEINVLRKTLCDDISVDFMVDVGRNPYIKTGEIVTAQHKNHQFDFFDNVLDGYKHCDTVRYSLPIDSLLKAQNMRGFALDSVCWYIREGSAKEEKLVYRAGDVSVPAVLLDSMDMMTTMRMVSYNACGVSDELSLKLLMSTRPKVELLRDSVSRNDSLCIGLDYPYYWKGTFPKNYTIQMTPMAEVFVNGEKREVGTEIDLKNGDDIRYEVVGHADEHFVIKNSDMPTCALDSAWKLELLALPDTVLHRDSVGYCMGSPEFNAVKLFKPGKSDFKWGEWKLNAGTVQKAQLPDLKLTGGVDTLRYKLSRSKGCYVEGKLLLRPRAVPELKLKDDAHYCLPYTIVNFRTESGLVETISLEKHYRLTVYEDMIASSKRRYVDLAAPANANFLLDTTFKGKKFIYELKNKLVDTALMGKCRVLDSVSLDFSAPSLKVLKNDELRYPWDEYEFSHLQAGKFVDTTHLVLSSLQWRLIPEGIDFETGLYGGAYTLTEADRSKDTLMFEVSAENYCGGQLKDTLHVELIHLKIRGYKDTICSNEKGYPLWEKVRSSHVDPSSVQWQIVYPSSSFPSSVRGELTAETGTGVKYKPGTADSVRIWFKAALEGVPDETLYDTVVLKINPEPVLEFTRDTLWACNDKILLNDIASAYLHTAYVTRIVSGDYVNQKREFGRWIGVGDYTFENENLENKDGDLFQRVTYEAVGLPGCQKKNAVDTVVLAQPVPAKVLFKRAHEEMCAGDRLQLDTLYTVKGEDPFVRYTWSRSGETQGNIVNNIYEATSPEDKVQELSVVTHKEYTCYDGNPSGQVVKTAPARLLLTVHHEPVFKVVHTHDTLCRGQETILIKQDWVFVESGHYPDYRDSVLVNGSHLMSGGMLYSLEEGAKEKLLVTVAQGRCSQWSTRSDTIYLDRLSAMLTGSFSVKDVCEGGQGQIDKVNLGIDPRAQQVTWSADGGTITDDNNYFVPNKEATSGLVHLTATAPHGCGTESMPDVPVHIGRQPELVTKEYRECRLEGHAIQIATEIKDPTVKVQKIMWYRIGTTEEYIGTTDESETVYTHNLDAEDVLQEEKLSLEARIYSEGACTGIFKDTVVIWWQEKPEVTIIDPIEVCQADPDGVDLVPKVQVKYAGKSEWLLQTVVAGSMSGTKFLPGEFSGTANIQLTAPGLFGCPDEVKTIPVTVKAAPESGFTIAGENCTGRQVELSPDNNQAQNYDWDFGDGTPWQSGNLVSHQYAVARTYAVVMMATFANGCVRKENQEWTVNPTPQAIFDLPTYLPINKLVSWSSASLPETVSCEWSLDCRSYSNPEVNHTFATAGVKEVQLIVTSEEGCTDTLVNSTEVLEEPVANFEVETNTCTGIVKITNKSTRANADVTWDFGNDSSVSHDWDPADHVYPLAYKDTTYTIRLTLKNVSASVDYTQRVSITSNLKPGFEVWVTDHCIKTDKQIKINTQGKAENTTIDWGDGTVLEWTLGDGPISVLSHTYPENQTTVSKDYTITLTSENACHTPAPEIRNVTVAPVTAKAMLQQENEDEDYKNLCYKHELAFWNKSFGFISRGYTCEWDFGDGTPLQSDTVTTKMKTHLFERPGTYEVRLRVKDECNEQRASLPITIIGNDSLDFAFGKDKDRLCTEDSVRIWLVQRGEAPFANLRWTLPDGTRRLNEDTVYYKFTDAGENWNVSLSAEADGCPATLQKKCVVQQTPKAMIEFSRTGVDTVGCTPLSLPFVAYNGKGSTDNIRFSWDFGDGSASIERQPPVKVFEREGRYKVKLAMESFNGCVGRDSLSVTAKVTPTAAFALSRHLVCSDEGDFEITAFNQTASPENCTFEWYRGNGAAMSMNPDTVSISFVNFHGKERIALRAIHKLSECASWMYDSIVASLPLKASLSVSPDTVCAGMEVVFRDTLSLAGVTREFYFDDGTLDDSREVSKTYWEPGKYAYRFVQRNADGCTDTLRDMVFVHTLPVAEFDWQEEILPVEIGNLRPGTELPAKGSNGIRFTSRSTLAPLEGEGSGLYYIWDFGDGQTAREREPAHRFENNGVYDVRLYAVTEQGCRDSISHLVEIATFKGLFFPNAMVPASSDPGVNRFQPKGIGLHAFTLKVYGPDGSCVWQTDKLDAGKPAEYWDGTYNGQPVPAGVYNWEASALFIDGTVQNHINGALIVIR